MHMTRKSPALNIILFSSFPFWPVAQPLQSSPPPFQTLPSIHQSWIFVVFFPWNVSFLPLSLSFFHCKHILLYFRVPYIFMSYSLIYSLCVIKFWIFIFFYKSIFCRAIIQGRFVFGKNFQFMCALECIYYTLLFMW